MSDAEKTKVETFNARAFEALVPGQEVYAITCPVLADALLRSRLGDQFKAIAHAYKQILGAVAKHGTHGVVRGTVVAVGDVTGLGLWTLDARVDGEPLFETASAFAEAGRPFDDFIGEHPWLKKHGSSFEAMMLSGLLGEQPEPPAWLRYTLLSEEDRLLFAAEDDAADAFALMMTDPADLDEETAALVKAMGEGGEAAETAEAELKRRFDARRPHYDTLSFVFPANATTKGFLEDMFRQVAARIRVDAEAEVQKRARFI